MITYDLASIQPIFYGTCQQFDTQKTSDYVGKLPAATQVCRNEQTSHGHYC